MPAKDEPLLGPAFAVGTSIFPMPMGPRGAQAIRAVEAAIQTGRYSLESVPCICGSDQDLCLATADRYGIPHRSVICTRCALIRTSPRMSAASYAHFYEHYYRAIYERPGHCPQSYFAMREAHGLRRAVGTLRHLSTGPGVSVVEIGCGGGWNLLAYLSWGWNVVGWDVDDEYLDLGRERGLDLRHGFLEDACKDSERFDLVVLSHVLEHLLNPIEDLRMLRGLLRPGGVLSIEVPSALATARLDRYFQSAHVWSFVPDTLRAVMAMSGWRCIAMNGVIESLWQPSDDSAMGLPENPGLVARTVRSLVARRSRSWWLERRVGLQHRWWRLAEAIRARPVVNLGPA